MKTEIFLTGALLSLSLAPIANANPSSTPITCPAASVIIADGLSSVAQEDGQKWAGSKQSSYGSSKQWLFQIGFFSAANAEDAMSKATRALSTLDYLYGPQENGSEWVCMYSTDYNALGFATAPVM